mmetsp:Transcript_20833/g.41981  ORF Transcript_20833/g.41981 Transcript_20833/m.41981 type:complete len:162 (+) Transcript_20833:54-539(+)
MIVDVVAAAQELRKTMMDAAEEAQLQLESNEHSAAGGAGGVSEEDAKKLRAVEEELHGLREVYHQTMEKMVEEKRAREAAKAMVAKLEMRLSKHSTAKDVHQAEEKYEKAQQKVQALEDRVAELEESHELTLTAMKESLEVTTSMLEETQRELSEYKEREG